MRGVSKGIFNRSRNLNSNSMADTATPFPPPVCNGFPRRIVCLSAEAADWLWRLGAWDSVVGVTAYFEPPPGAPAKPRVSGFSSAQLQPILHLQPDLVITFSDVQAGIAAQLVSHGCPVLATNQRTLAEAESTLALLARLVNRSDAGETLLREFRALLAPATAPLRRPRVYFEEWNAPLITGIAWVSELIERAGGTDVFGSLSRHRAAPDRIVTAAQVRAANPEIIFASWCGQPVNLAAFGARPGWREIAAIRTGAVQEIRSADLLQPGFGLARGYAQLRRHIENWATAVAGNFNQLHGSTPR
jgi:iron complex transport system substrate-binding protein